MLAPTLDRKSRTLGADFVVNSVSVQLSVYSFGSSGPRGRSSRVLSSVYTFTFLVVPKDGQLVFSFKYD